MKNNSVFAKVITMTIALNEQGHKLTIIIAVDPYVTPEMAKCLFGIPGSISSAEETNVMPLTFALDYAQRQCEKFEIPNYVSYSADLAA